ncbi:hypothetical protein V1514DRAFT_208564 [Lipomyces japonicus]|uniref:mitochondrial 54S ribosomal protein uL30m n=1 Tax=Lipomyces japonicus TaxID=56871 RepID=UPI0034CE7C63
MSFYKVTMTRSTIGLPSKFDKILKALGLKKRGSVAYHNISPAIASMILNVKELVKVDLVEKKLTREEHRESQKTNPGYYVEKPVGGERKNL